MTPLVRDAKGRKMSKSLGNGIDPLEVVAEFGADALKFTMVYLSAQGQDINLDKEGFKLGSKFANKIWNASRYLLMNIPDEGVLPSAQIVKNDVDRWIEGRLNATIRNVDDAMAAYRYNDVGHAVYEFFWNDFCDWYIEATKLEFNAGAERKRQAVSKLVLILEESLRLLHPFLSFITEEIYQQLPGHGFSLVTAPYPVADPARDDPKVEARFAVLQDLIRGIRTLRSVFAIPPEQDIAVVVGLDTGYAHTEFLKAHRDLAALFTGSDKLAFGVTGNKPAGAVTVVGKGFESYVLVRELIDVPKEKDKLKKSIEKTAQYAVSVEKKLSNQAFVASAPAEIVEGERAKLAEARDNLGRLTAYLAELEG
jgi:valyl-tRNA synthetase